jgi:hypothetical protein
MQLSLARNFAKGIDLGKRAWIPLAEASTVPAGDTHNQLGEAPGPIASSSECVLMHARHVARSWYHWRCYHRVQTRDPRHSPHSDGSVPRAGSVRNHGLNLFRTSLRMDTYLAEGGFPMSPFSKSASGFSADTSAISGASRRCPSEWS